MGSLPSLRRYFAHPGGNRRTTQVLHPLAVEYLERLQAAAKRLPRSRRAELLADIEAHLAEAVPPDAGDAEALTALDRLGDPDDIVAAELPPPVIPADARGAREWSAIVLLLFGGFLFGVGWLTGLVLLWSSRCWNVKEKWLGTLVVPGGWLTGLFVLNLAASHETCTTFAGGPQHCTGGPGTGTEIWHLAVAAFFVLGPIASAIYLAHRAKVPPALR